MLKLPISTLFSRSWLQDIRSSLIANVHKMENQLSQPYTIWALCTALSILARIRSNVLCFSVIEVIGMLTVYCLNRRYVSAEYQYNLLFLSNLFFTKISFLSPVVRNQSKFSETIIHFDRNTNHSKQNYVML